MNVAEIFIRRPVMTALVMLGILMFGIMGYRLLPVSDRDKDVKILALRHQIMVLERQLGKSPATVLA